MGMACQPTRLRWCTVEVSRKVRGRTNDAEERYADGAQHLQKRFGVVLETDRRTTDGFEAGDHSIGLRARRRSFAIDVMHPVEQATKAVGHPNKDQLLPVILEASGQALQ